MVCLCLALATTVIYWPITGHDFTTYDDPDYVTQNPHVQAGLCLQSLVWVWHSDVARNWHPVTMLSHVLDWQLWGGKAGGHHFSNLLLHTANAVLLSLLLHRMTGALWRSAVVASLFALHPLHVESVAWVAERKDVLSTFFFLLTLMAYVEYVQSPKSKVPSPKRAGAAPNRTDRPDRTDRAEKSQTGPPSGARSRACWYLVALLLFALGLMSKPMLVTLPCVLLLLDFWPLARFFEPLLSPPPPAPAAHRIQSSRFKVQGSKFVFTAILLEKLPFLLLSAISCVITYRVQDTGGSVLDLSNLPLSARLSNALVSYVRYLGKMFWPDHLAALYLKRTPWSAGQIALAALLLLLISTLAALGARRRPYLIVGWLWYLGTLVPVIGLVQVGMQSMADRYTYIPLIGVFIMLAWGGAEISSKVRQASRLPAQGASSPSLENLARGQGDWSANPPTRRQYGLSHAQAKMASSPQPSPPEEERETCGSAGWFRGLAVLILLVLACCAAVTRAQLPHWQNSETLYLQMISVDPGNYMARYNLGNLYDRQNEPQKTQDQYEAAIAAEPNYWEAHSNLGNLLLRQRNLGRAVNEYEAAVRIRPVSVSYFNLANTLVDAGRSGDAVVAYRKALELDPTSSQAHHNLGRLLQTQGKATEAIAHFRAALASQPDLEPAHYCLANLLAENGNLAEAVTHYISAERLNPDRAESYNGLGICYAMQNQFDHAERQLRQAVRLTPDNPASLSNLANALGAQNKVEEAIPYYQKALVLNPKDFQTHYNLAVSLMRQQKTSAAKAHLEQALRLHPDYPEAQRALATLGSQGQ